MCPTLWQDFTRATRRAVCTSIPATVKACVPTRPCRGGTTSPRATPIRGIPRTQRPLAPLLLRALSLYVLASGYDTLAENYLHAVVVHAGWGGRIGCGVLGGASATPFATGDPHLQNIHGERFDLMKPGKHLLIQIPRKSSENTLLRVDAEAKRMGAQCTDMYFQELNITGAWADAKQTGGFYYRAQDVDGAPAHWEHFGNVQLKVAHGRTQKGIKYLNIYVKDLMRAGSVGGLLGDDDHTEAATPPEACVRRLSLLHTDVETSA